MSEVQKRRREFEYSDQIADRIWELSEFLSRPSHKFGVMLTGKCGNGKTTMTRALQRMIGILDYHRFYQEYLTNDFDPSFRIVDANYIAEVAKNKDAFEDLKSRWLLAIDDLGEEPTEILDFGNTRYPIARIIEFRYFHQLFTVITTNLDGNMLYERYGERVYDRITEMFHVITFEEDSYRK